MITTDLTVYHTAEKLPTREATEWTHKWSFNSMKRHEIFTLPFSQTGSNPHDWVPYIEEHIQQFTDMVVKVHYTGLDQRQQVVTVEPLQFRLFPNVVQLHRFNLTTSFDGNTAALPPL